MMRQEQAEEALRHLGFLNMSIVEAEVSSSDLITAIKGAYTQDAHTRAHARYRVKLHKGLLTDSHDRIIVPENTEIRALIIRESHDIEVSGHLGINKTVMRIRRHLNWNGLVRDVRQFVWSCASCQSSKSSNVSQAGLAQPSHHQ